MYYILYSHNKAREKNVNEKNIRENTLKYGIKKSACVSRVDLHHSNPRWSRVSCILQIFPSRIFLLRPFSWKVSSHWMPKMGSNVGYWGLPGWLSWLSDCLQLSSWFLGPGIEPHFRLSAKWGVCYFLRLCLFPHPCSLFLILSQINKSIKLLE